ncbi:MAG: hypothetical protein K1X64_04700 [Myxococcaceae bacterium]|nr:hypothetical protein [Myxococcaceae bacterium]
MRGIIGEWPGADAGMVEPATEALDAGPFVAESQRFVYVLNETEFWASPPHGAVTNVPWRDAARAYFAAVDAGFRFSVINGLTWNTVGPANSGTEWSVDAAWGTVSARQDAVNASTARQHVLSLDIEGSVVPRGSHSQRAAPGYAENLAAITSVVTRFSKRYGAHADGGVPLGFYSAGTGNSYYFGESQLRAYRSANYPTGYAFDGREFTTPWRWANVVLAFSGRYVASSGGPEMQTYAPYGSAPTYPAALGTFVREFAQDWLFAAYDLPEWQPLLRAQDVLAPAYYAYTGFPDVETNAATRADAGETAGLGGESAYHYASSKHLARWIAAQNDHSRQFIPYVSSLIYGARYAIAPGDSRPADAGDFWDIDDWWASAGSMWLNQSNTYVTSGQVRVPFSTFINMLEAMQRGSAAGGHPLDGIYFWEPYGWALGNARIYVANGRTQPALAEFLVALWRIVMTEWALPLPDDAQWLAPIFGGTYDRHNVFGALARKPLDTWTLSDVDEAIALIWKVRVQAYLEAARSVFEPR